MRRRTSPVQQWVNSIPSPTNSSVPISADVKLNSLITSTPAKDIPLSKGNYSKIPTMTVSAPINVPGPPAINMSKIPSSVPHGRLARDQSFQSDSSHCSSVESLLELRKADPEAILLSLGFGGCSNSPQEIGPLSRIPKRFLQPSKLKGIAINDFVKKQQETSESFDSVSLGYRGLTGSPYVAPSEIVQKIMERLREHESHEMDVYTVYNSYEQYNKMHQQTRQSVLSSDNRQFLEQPRSRSPDMRNKRMIIGQKSFAFGHNGDLIEICIPTTKKSNENIECYYNTDYISTSKELKNMYIKSEMPPTKELGKLSNQFNDSIDSSGIDELLLQTSNHLNNQLTISTKSKTEEKEKTQPIVTITQNNDHNSKYIDSRRASEVFDQINLRENGVIQDGRRFSDSVITEQQINEDLLLRRRRSLKRQLRVNEFDTINFHHSSPMVTEILQDKKSGSNTSSDIHEIREQNGIEELNLCKSNYSAHSLEYKSEIECLNTLEANQNNSPSEIYKCPPNVSGTSEIFSTMTLLNTKDNCKKKNQVCCCKGKIERIYRTEEIHADCCCQFDDSKCWEKVEKIMQENKKLEDIVAKSRIEMAEIRDMLNSVLSVRMEPGF
ncbi:hypothetical protein KPH14_002424 [Odynerus spinipes]|uniref:ITPR-interacting domain-containing protein n=1 Tax=Odynerus spinipes TaxID=1348599 RepID=A0AAD9RLI3_9HYME|nr:hypothetical protein KPH14_002424 [Odynerus spinipes]